MSEKEPITEAPPARPAGSPYPYPYAFPYVVEDEEIDLREYWQVLVRYKKLISAITSVTTAIALLIALVLTPIFRAEVLLAPVSNEPKPGLGGLAGQFGDLASLVGINLGVVGRTPRRKRLRP